MKRILRRIAGGIALVFGFAFARFAGIATVSRHNTDTVWWAIACLFVAFMSFMWLIFSEAGQGSKARLQRGQRDETAT